MKVLILTASFGDGHTAAARGVRDALEILGPGTCRVEVLDLLDAAYGRLNRIARSAYLRLIRHAPSLWKGVYHLLDRSPGLTAVASSRRLRGLLTDVLREFEPDAVVSTYPLYADVLDEVFRDHAERPFRLYTVVTDSISIHASWYRSPSDRYCVTNAQTAEVLAKAGVERARVQVTGFPVSPEFMEEAGVANPLPEPRRAIRVLYVARHGRNKTGRTLDDLLEVPGLELTVTTGRDAALKARLLERMAGFGDRVRVLGWTNQMPQLLKTHHLVIGKAGGASVQEAIAARCPLILNQTIPGQEEGNARLVETRGYGMRAEGRKEVLAAVRGAMAEGAKRWRFWKENLERDARPDAALRLAGLILAECGERPEFDLEYGAGRPTRGTLRSVAASRVGSARSAGPLLCDFHTHTNYSDGRLSVPELVDFYGNHGFDCICITDHLADPRRLIGRLAGLSRLTVSPDQLAEYFSVIRQEAARAWRRYRMLVMAGMEFNKDGCTARSSAHLLGIDLKHPIRPDLDLPETIAAIHEQGGLAVASHPHLMSSEWGKNTLHLWENQEKYAPLLDAWEIANRDNIFSPVALKRLPYLANSDFHKPKHIYSWKTLVDAPKDPEAIKDCIRRNRGISITLYRRNDCADVPAGGPATMEASEIVEARSVPA